jgi:hypothetical protein
MVLLKSQRASAISHRSPSEERVPMFLFSLQEAEQCYNEQLFPTASD